jgi:hypothetical protein
MAKRTSRLGRIGKFFRKERMAVVRDIEKQKLPRWVDVQHKKITVGEAMERLKGEHSQITLGLLRPVPHTDKRRYYQDFERYVKRVAPQAKIEYMPLQWMVKNKVKDPFRDVKISNLSIGEALEIGSYMSFTIGQWKG